MPTCSKPDYKGVLKGIEYVPIVSGPERARYEAIGQAAWGQFMFTNLVPNSTGVTLPRCPALEYYPILYLWPVDGNMAAIGTRDFNLSSVESGHGTHTLFSSGDRQAILLVPIHFLHSHADAQAAAAWFLSQAVAFVHLFTLAA
jgi:hypothetical protein